MFFGINIFQSDFRLDLNAQVYSDFTLPDVEGNDITLSKNPIFEKPHARGDISEKGCIMISFWATWCAPCKEELKKMNNIYLKYKDNGFDYYAISIDDQKSVAKVKSFAESYKYSFNILLDTDRKVFEAYGGVEEEVPYSVLISHDKEVRYKHLGFITGDEVKIEQEIKSLLGIQ